MFGRFEVCNRHLVRAPSAFNRLAIDKLRASPSLGRAQHDHRPAGPLDVPVDPSRARFALNLLNLRQSQIERARQTLVYLHRVVTLDKKGLMSVAVHQIGQLLVADACQHGGVGNLEAVEMKNGQYRAVAHRIQELVGMPTGS